MSQEEIFHRQLINSYVTSVAVGRFEEFMVRSELLRRTREFINGPHTPTAIAKATATLFFGGDSEVYNRMLDMSHRYDPINIYPIETFLICDTTIKSVDFE